MYIYIHMYIYISGEPAGGVGECLVAFGGRRGREFKKSPLLDQNIK